MRSVIIELLHNKIIFRLDFNHGSAPDSFFLEAVFVPFFLPELPTGEKMEREREKKKKKSWGYNFLGIEQKSEMAHARHGCKNWGQFLLSFSLWFLSSVRSISLSLTYCTSLCRWLRTSLCETQQKRLLSSPRWKKPQTDVLDGVTYCADQDWSYLRTRMKTAWVPEQYQWEYENFFKSFNVYV